MRPVRDFAVAALIAMLNISAAAAPLVLPVPGSFAVGPQQNVVAPPGAVILGPTVPVQSVVDRHAPGTVYFLSPGLYRTQQIIPKNGDMFLGAPGAVLNGARLLTRFIRAGKNYVATDETPDPGTREWGECRPEYPRCKNPQDLYMDGRPLRAVARSGDVVAGSWYFDFSLKQVVFADNPDGHVIELSYRPFAFGGDARGVTIRNLTVEKYASANQQGAVNGNSSGAGWIISNNEVRWNHGIGIVAYSNNQALGNYIHHNGHTGLGAGGSRDILVQGNEISYNTWNGVRCIWECGGAKFGKVSNLTVAGNYVHHNQGEGLWTDVECVNITYDSNVVEDNLLAGIAHEISFDSVIRNNVLRGNGAAKFEWGWWSQIQIQNSTNTEVYGNILVLDPVRGGNGITIVQQDRGPLYNPRNISIHDNDITMAGGYGVVAGWFADFRPSIFRQANNIFDRNHYHVVASAQSEAWAVNRFGDFSDWRLSGQDLNGVIEPLNAAKP